MNRTAKAVSVQSDLNVGNLACILEKAFQATQAALNTTNQAFHPRETTLLQLFHLGNIILNNDADKFDKGDEKRAKCCSA